MDTIITGDEIKTRRKRIGLLQIELARICQKAWGIKNAQQMISKWESGVVRPKWRADDIDRILTRLERKRLKELQRRLN